MALAGRKPPPGKPQPAPYCTSWSAPTDYVLTPAPSGHPSMGHIHPARQGIGIFLLGDRAIPKKNFCNIKCLQLQGRKIVMEFSSSDDTGHLWFSSKSHCRAAAPKASDVLHTRVQLNQLGKPPLYWGALGCRKELTPIQDLSGREQPVGKIFSLTCLRLVSTLSSPKGQS